MIPKIALEQVSLNYPIYGSSARSFKRDIIRLVSLGKIIQKEPSITSIQALNNISLCLNQGDSLGLIGLNGAGKSTLLRVMSGIYSPTGGSIHVNGDISALIGSSAAGLKPELTAYENIKLNSVIHGHHREQTEAIIRDVEEFTELNDFLYLPIKTYSSGMKARLAFSLTTAVKPDILLIDEVIGTGDASFMDKAKNRMDKLLKKANILVMASHNIEIIKSFCTQLLWLHKGEVMALGPLDEVMREYNQFLSKKS